MSALFFYDSNGTVARDPVPEKGSVTGTFCRRNVLSAVESLYNIMSTTPPTWDQQS